MSTIIAELYDALREAGVSEDKARAAAAAVIGADTEAGFATKADISLLRSEMQGLRSDIEELQTTTKSDLEALRAATKSDLEALRAATKSDIAALQATTQRDLETQRNSLRADIEAFRLANRADLSDLRAELIKWNVGTIIAMTAIFAAIVKLL